VNVHSACMTTGSIAHRLVGTPSVATHVDCRNATWPWVGMAQFTCAQFARCRNWRIRPWRTMVRLAHMVCIAFRWPGRVDRAFWVALGCLGRAGCAALAWPDHLGPGPYAHLGDPVGDLCCSFEQPDQRTIVSIDTRSMTGWHLPHLPPMVPAQWRSATALGTRRRHSGRRCLG
jgi:hypothetical protein